MLADEPPTLTAVSFVAPKPKIPYFAVLTFPTSDQAVPLYSSAFVVVVAGEGSVNPV